MINYKINNENIFKCFFYKNYISSIIIIFKNYIPRTYIFYII